ADPPPHCPRPPFPPRRSSDLSVTAASTAPILSACRAARSRNAQPTLPANPVKVTSNAATADQTVGLCRRAHLRARWRGVGRRARSEEHTSELQSRFDLVCRLL